MKKGANPDSNEVPKIQSITKTLSGLLHGKKKNQ
jgi:hypothetical protein